MNGCDSYACSHCREPINVWPRNNDCGCEQVRVGVGFSCGTASLDGLVVRFCVGCDAVGNEQNEGHVWKNYISDMLRSLTA